MNKLYIIEDVLCDYTSGIAIICASSLDRCREIYVEKWNSDGFIQEFDGSIRVKKYKVIEGVNHAEGIVSYLYGGG